VLDWIVKNGSISTDDLKELGYNHAPRAARDVRELGIRLKTTSVKNGDGKRMASYSFADQPLETGKKGRTQFPKKLRADLIAKAAGRCEICGSEHNLQIDHRIPYAIGGEPDAAERNVFQVLCGSCNRTKSWACEHCPNMNMQDKKLCGRCYWADPSDYDHVAMSHERRIDVVWSGGEVHSFERLREQAKRNNRSVVDEVKALLD